MAVHRFEVFDPIDLRAFRLEPPDNARALLLSTAAPRHCQ
jgi:hypothetical protein